MKWFKLILLFLGVIFIGGVYAFSQFMPKQLSAEAARERWGNAPFNPAQFKSGSRATRAKMAFQILKTQPYVGKSVLEVRKNLGPNEGYYKNDVVPAYILNDEDDEVWQIVFIVDVNRTVKKVVIYEN